MFGLSPMELFLVLGVVVLMFGTRRLPELGSGLGKAISNFRRSYKEGTEIDVTPRSGDAAEKSSSDSADKK